MVRWQSLSNYFKRLDQYTQITLRQIVNGERIWFNTNNAEVSLLAAYGFIVPNENGYCAIRNKMTQLYLSQYFETERAARRR